MKIRNGFVSNSSSSSFLIFGADWSSIEEEMCDDLKEKFKGLERDDQVDVIDELIKDTGLRLKCPYEGEEDYWTIGISPENCPDDMTMGDFKKDVEAKLKSIFGTSGKTYWAEASWYNG